jgi:hypothetical protein
VANTSAAAAAGSTYYLGSSATEVDLLTWNSAGVGTVTYDTIKDNGQGTSPEFQLNVQTTDVKVTVNGSQVTISVPLGGTLNGTIGSGGSLTITGNPDPNTGLVQSGTLMPSDPNSYNQAVAALNSAIAQANGQAAAAQASASQAAQVA